MKKIIFSIIILGIVSGGCKKFIDVNNNPNAVEDVKEPFILSPAELSISTNITSGNANIIVNHWMQNVALNQPVPNSGTFLQNNVDFDADWTNIYVTSLNNLNALNKKAEENGNSNYSGIAKILMAYCFGTSTDYWGDIPFTDAFKGSENLKPSYDKQEDIYKSIQSLLDNGISDINSDKGILPGADDYFYAGDMSKWVKLAYTLKARYYMHLINAPGYTATTQADLALAALQQGMDSNDDDLKMLYPGDAGHENPYYLTFLPVSTLVLSEHLVNGFKLRNDPRMDKMIAPAAATGLDSGRVIGATDLGNLDDYSLLGPVYGGTDAYVFIVNYSEALFLAAEATLIKSGAATAETIYENAIRSHMTKLDIPDAAITDYLAARGSLTTGNALQLIMEEKSIADFFCSENFADWRRTGFPALTKPPGALSDIPRRIIYPQTEILNNPQPALQSAKLTDRIWWDK